MTMSLRDVDAIDYIGVNILFRRVYVGLFDELDWSDEREHQNLLTKKIDRYIRYIRSGQLLLNYPKVRSYEIVVEYVSMHSMPPSAVEFWRSRERVLEDAGYKVHIRGVDVRRSLGICHIVFGFLNRGLSIRMSLVQLFLCIRDILARRAFAAPNRHCGYECRLNCRCFYL